MPWLAPDDHVTVVGQHCEAGDVLIKDALLPADVRPGDLMAVAATGAYNVAMASNYNLVMRPPLVGWRRGAARCWCGGKPPTTCWRVIWAELVLMVCGHPHSKSWSSCTPGDYARSMGDIGKKRRRIEVLPITEPAPREPATTEPRKPEPAREPVPAR